MSSEDYEVIDLAEVERARVRELIERTAPFRSNEAACPYGLYFVDASGRFGVLGRSVEVEVFWEIFENDRKLLAVEYGPFDRSSFFILVVDHEAATVAGAMRVISPSSAGLKTLHDIEKEPSWAKSFDDICRYHDLDISLERVWDVATLAVRKPWRAGLSGSIVSLGLYHGIFAASLLAGTECLIVCLDDAVTQLMVDFGTPWQRVCDLPPVSFLGSPATSPMLLDMRGLGAVLGTASDLGRMICTGEGFEGQLSRPTLPVDAPPMSPVDLEPIDAPEDVSPKR